VVKAEGPIFVELHRYNVGRERTPAKPGSWPRPLPASLAAADAAADLAVLRIENVVALPYVARLAPDQGPLAPDSKVTSVGIDLGAKLTTWTTQLVKTLRFELNDSRSERLFLITVHTPEHGPLRRRSVPGQRRARGGVRRARRAGRRTAHGVFASRESIRQLLDDHDQLSALIVRSEKRRALVTGRSPTMNPNPAARAPASSVVTPTRSLNVEAEQDADGGP